MPAPARQGRSRQRVVTTRAGEDAVWRDAGAASYQLPPPGQPPWPTVVQVRFIGPVTSFARTNELPDFDFSVSL